MANKPVNFPDGHE